MRSTDGDENPIGSSRVVMECRWGHAPPMLSLTCETTRQPDSLEVGKSKVIPVNNSVVLVQELRRCSAYAVSYKCIDAYLYAFPGGIIRRLRIKTQTQRQRRAECTMMVVMFHAKPEDAGGRALWSTLVRVERPAKLSPKDLKTPPKPPPPPLRR